MITEQEESRIRLWLAVTHQDFKCRIYADDGELQCNNFSRHGKCIDFKRDSITDILNIIQETRIKENALCPK